MAKRIAAEALGHRFERFWRADRRRDRNSGGIRAGLAIGHCLIEFQDGTIRVESALDQGSIFQCSLPNVLGTAL
ncbi:MAG: cell wall metabolism sensor histidine kinase WalK [Pseudanabaenales cyanobacterium]|nr:cell wall metabolism sensor histidine kinase WalK [Pseudanabaenales cyanobacterium]